MRCIRSSLVPFASILLAPAPIQTSISLLFLFFSSPLSPAFLLSSLLSLSSFYFILCSALFNISISHLPPQPQPHQPVAISESILSSTDRASSIEMAASTESNQLTPLQLWPQRYAHDNPLPTNPSGCEQGVHQPSSFGYGCGMVVGKGCVGQPGHSPGSCKEFVSFVCLFLFPGCSRNKWLDPADMSIEINGYRPSCRWPTGYWHDAGSRLSPYAGSIRRPHQQRQHIFGVSGESAT